MPRRRPIGLRFLVVALCLGLAAPALSAPGGRRGRAVKKARVKGKPARRDGLAFCNAAITRIARRTAQGKRTCVVFDIDNTLVDTRLRTRAAAHAFGALRTRGRAKLSGLTLARVGYDGFQTAQKLGYGWRSSGAFQQFWRGFFWNGKNFKHDAPMAPTVGIVRRAKAAGAEVFYLTGRVDRFQKNTVKQLKRLGLPDADNKHVLSKPSTLCRLPDGRMDFTPTAPFKVKQLKQLRREGFHVGLFMSDAASDIAAVQKRTSISCVKVDFPVSPPSEPWLKPNTPVIRIK